MFIFAFISNILGSGRIAGGGEGRHSLAQIGVFYCDTNHNSYSKKQVWVFKIYFYLGVPGLSCGMWDLVPLPLHREPRTLPLDYQGSPRNR